MSIIEDGGTAFPTSIQISQNNTTGETTTYQYLSDGMSLRDYFAAKAMEAMITKGMEDNKRGAKGVPFIVEYAYEYADAMIKQREKGSAK